MNFEFKFAFAYLETMAGTLRGLKINYMKIGKWIVENPRTSVCIGIALGSPELDFYLKKHVVKEMKVPVYNKLVEGSKPVLLDPKILVPRPDIIAYIREEFFLRSEDVATTRFGVVIGPSGSGKTSAIRNLCSRHPEGILYYEISEPSSFVTNLSKELGMKTDLENVFDLILGRITKRYTHYLVLPESGLRGLDMVHGLLESVSTQYVKIFRRVPVLFLDGVDLLAKCDPEMCSHLIIHTKILANNKILKVVLVSK